MEIKKSSVAQALYIKYCHQQSGYSLLDMYTQEDNHEELALYHITESIKSNVLLQNLAYYIKSDLFLFYTIYTIIHTSCVSF